MSVTNLAAGITSEHIAAIEQTCRELNTFLLVRPSEVDTMELIGQGYATKSMDVHDKSSNWGPAAGFVPCDPAFCKTPRGVPNPNLHAVNHGEAKVVTLRLTDSLADPKRNVRIIEDTLRKSGDSKRYVKAVGDAKTGPKAKTFVLTKHGTEWEVAWLNGDTEVPLKVWGYQADGTVKPVTGDYDLWMVAPHIERWSQHMQVMGIKDSHGESGATMFITDLLRRLNAACGRANNPVFNHGAESQNYGFTQAIDDRMVMFSPGGASEIVRRDELPKVLVDMQRAGYLVYWNKRYGERDPELMGNAFAGGVAGGVAGGGGSRVSALIAEADSLLSAPPATGKNADLTNALRKSPLVRKALVGRGDEAVKIQRIQDFHKALVEAMAQLDSEGGTGPLKTLQVPLHIPQVVWNKATQNVAERHALQQQLQNAVVKLSEMDRGFVKNDHGKDGPTAGAALAPDPAKWSRWYAENWPLFMKLQNTFGSSPASLTFERIPGTRAYKVGDTAGPKASERIAGLIRQMGLK
jgi:hypothetical protein